MGGRSHPSCHRPKRRQVSIPSSLDNSQGRKCNICFVPTPVAPVVGPPAPPDRSTSPTLRLAHVAPGSRQSLKRNRSGDGAIEGDASCHNTHPGRKRLRLSASPMPSTPANNSCPPPLAARPRSLTAQLPRISLSLFNRVKSMQKTYLPSLSRGETSANASPAPNLKQSNVSKVSSRSAPPRDGITSVESCYSHSPPSSLSSFPSLPSKVAPNGEATRVEIPFERFYNQVFHHEGHAQVINDVAEKIMRTRPWAEALRTYGKSLRVERRFSHSGDRKNHFLELLNYILRSAPTCGFNIEFENDIEYQRHTFDGRPNPISVRGASTARVLTSNSNVMVYVANR